MHVPAGVSSRKRLMALLLVGLGLFLLNYWMASLRQYSSNFDITEKDALFGEDAMQVLINGRQLADYGRISTFVWPGYMWHGTVKETLLFLPSLLLGFREWIPVVMAALVGAFIPWAVYLLLRRIFGTPAAVIGLVLSGAFDVFIAQNVFMLGFPFDVQVALSLGFALFVIGWADALRSGRQPGTAFCAAMGILAGILLYAHPVALPVLLATGLFLGLAGGRRMMTWRLAVVAAGGALGSARLWSYWLKYVPLSAFMSLDAQRPERYSWRQYLWGEQGLFVYLFSPSGNRVTWWVLGGVFVVTVAVVAWRVARWMVAQRPGVLRMAWREGFPLPLWAYGVILFPCYMVFMQRMSGVARFGGPVHNYSVELWFWQIMALAAWLGWLWRRQWRLALALTVVAALFLYTDLVLHFPRPTPRLLKLYAEYRDDAARLVSEGKQPLLYAQEMNGHVYPYLAPAPLVAADGLWNLGLRDPVAAVERHPHPPVLASLDQGVLGSNAWHTLALKTATVSDTFRMPPAGRWLSPTSWVWSVNGQPFAPGGAVCDGNLATAWAQSRTNDVPRLEWTFRFDRPRAISRLVMMAICEKGIWWPSTYFRFKTHFARRVHPREFMPAAFSVEGLMADTGRWELLVPKAGDPDFFWDGGRLFFDEKERCRLDMRLPVRTVTALRLVEERTGDLHWRKISELALFEDDAPGAGVAGQDEARLWDRLRTLAPRRLYADRYVSAQAQARLPGLAVWLPSVLRPPCYLDDYQVDWPWYTALEPLKTDGAVIVADTAWAPAIDATLSRHGVTYDQESFGAWTLYRFDGCGVTAPRDLVWNGMGVWSFPAMRPAGGSPAPARLLTPPLRFANGAELVAVEAGTPRVRREQPTCLRFYWRLPPHWPGVTSRPWLFCHLSKDHYVVNIDHPVLAEQSETDLLAPSPEGWVAETVEVVLPSQAPAGRYMLEFGLLGASGKRVPVSGADPGVRVDRRNAVWIPAFEVLP